MKELNEQINGLIIELEQLMDNVPGNVERIKDCTLKEEWRHECCYSFADSDMDRGLFKEWYDYFEGGPDERTYIFEIACRCDITYLPMLVKYPLIAKVMKADKEDLED